MATWNEPKSNYVASDEVTPQIFNELAENEKYLKETQETKITSNDVKEATINNTQSSTRTNLTTTEKLSTGFGKIRKWFADLKALAFKDTVGNSDITDVAASKVTGLHGVATSGSYNDLNNKPNLNNYVPKITKINDKELSQDIDLTASDVGAAEQVHSHLQYLTEESDPTVPSWAKQPNKPSYTPSEVGADPAGTASSEVNAHNNSSTSHLDLRNEITKSSSYDIIIRTQEQFDLMLASATWLNAQSVLICGGGGAGGTVYEGTDWTDAPQGAYVTNALHWNNKVPLSVRKIEGINNAVVYIKASFYPAFGYDGLPPSDDYIIDGITLYTIGTSTSYPANGFSYCRNLYNCSSYSLTVQSGNAKRAAGFWYCYNMVDCYGEGKGVGTVTNSTVYGGAGFARCENIVNCRGKGEGTEYTYGAGAGFAYCTNVLNSKGVGDGSFGGYSFYTCSYSSNCKSDGASKTAIWGGANIKRDDDSCELD